LRFFSNFYFEIPDFLSYLCDVLNNNGVITKAGGNRPYERLATPHSLRKVLHSILTMFRKR